MISLLLECAIRSALIIPGTALVLWILRIGRPSARHTAWAAVVLAMLALPLWSWGGPRLCLHVLQPPAAPTGAAIIGTLPSAVAPSIPDEVVSETTPSPSTPRARVSWPQVLLGVYWFGLIALVVRLAIGTIYANRLRRSATTEDGRATSDRCATPITIGWVTPTLILPNGWQAWPSSMLSAVLTHEREHARRRDPLVQWLALLNRAVFWFHPLAWWLERRLAALAEESCDAVVLAAGHSPHAYADYLLDLARTVAVRGQRLRAVGMAMPGSALKERVRLILDNAVAPPISRVRMACAVVFCAASTGLFADATLASRAASSIDALGPANTFKGPEGPIAKFDVVSVKPCKAGDVPPGARAGGSGRPTATPGRLRLDCFPLVGANGLIRRAYATFASGTHNAYLQPSAVPVEGGPAWTTTDHYTIEATAEGTPTVEMMNGPMLQALLEDRFKLKVRRETREIPVYDLTVAKGGSKLKPFDGPCTPVDFTKGNIPAQLEAEGSCPIAMRNTKVDAPGQTIGDFVAFVLVLLDRPVIDKTGLSGRFDLHLDFTPEDGHVIDDLTTTLATAVQQQLGLKIAPAKGPGEFLVIDHVERPTPNDAPATAAEVPQGTAAAKTSFEVASIKPCRPEPAPPGARSGGGNGSFSPGRVYLTCFVVKNLVSVAYIDQRGHADAGDPLDNWPFLLGGDPGGPQRVRGGPSWVYSDKYTIEASAPGLDPTNARGPDRAVMQGPMLRALLEDRFKLKVHQEVEEVPMWALTAAKGGLKVKPMEPGGCSTDRSNGPINLSKAASLGVKPTCGTVNGGPDGPNWRWEHAGQNLAAVAAMLSSDLGVKVIDQTGIKDLFNITWEYGPDDNTPGTLRWFAAHPPEVESTPTAANVYTALEEQIGLKLEKIQGPRGYIVIDHIERPVPNGPAPAGPARSLRAGR